MSYISKHLHAKEKLVHRGRFHWMEYVKAWSALVFLGIFIIGIVIFVRILVKVMTTEFSITSQRIIVKRGLIATDVNQMALDGIEGANVKQGIFGRLLNYGQVRIEGRGDTELSLPVMAAPADFVTALAAIQDAEAHAAQAVEVVGIETPLT